MDQYKATHRRHLIDSPLSWRPRYCRPRKGGRGFRNRIGSSSTNWRVCFFLFVASYFVYCLTIVRTKRNGSIQRSVSSQSNAVFLCESVVIHSVGECLVDLLSGLVWSLMIGRRGTSGKSGPRFQCRDPLKRHWLIAPCNPNGELLDIKLCWKNWFGTLKDSSAKRQNDEDQNDTQPRQRWGLGSFCTRCMRFHWWRNRMISNAKSWHSRDAVSLNDRNELSTELHHLPFQSDEKKLRSERRISPYTST